MKGKNLFLLCCNILVATWCFAQTLFVPAKDNTATLEELIGRYEKKHQERIASLSSSDKKEYQDIYTLRWKLIREKFDKKEVYTNPDAQQYLDALVDEIVLANPQLNRKSFDVFFSKSGNPNASFLGEGIILFNMGLFKRLSNESQAVFIICHELAHFYLEHSDAGIQQYVTNLNTVHARKAFKKRKYNTGGAKSRIASSGIAFSRQNVQNEILADSMALELMKETRFDAREAISTLAVLEKAADFIDMKSTLEKVFHSEAYPFRERWIPESGSIKKRNQIQSALNTHPDLQSRTAIVSRLLAKRPEKACAQFNNNARFPELQKLFGYEIVEYYYTAGNYSRSLFHALEITASNLPDPYVTTHIGKILIHLSEACEDLTLGKFIELPSQYQQEEYNVLLNFIHALQREEYATISYHYLKQFEPQLGFYQPFRNTLRSSIQIAKL